MNTTFKIGVIPPEAIAYKLLAWRFFKTPKFAKQAKALPRLPELLWFIQSQSMQPGGLDRFIVEFLAAFPDRLCTPSMRRHGKKQSYTSEERTAIMAEIPRHFQYRQGDFPAADVASAFWDKAETVLKDKECGERRIQPNTAFVSKLDRAAFSDLCRAAARNHLAEYLTAFCLRGREPRKPYEEQGAETYGVRANWEPADRPLEDVWYFDNLPGAIIEMLDIHAQKAAQQLVMTAVACQCFDGLKYAWTERGLVSIEGDTRFGKTQSVRTWAEMFPGQARLVRTPYSASERDLFQAIAEAVGMETTFKTSLRELREKVEMVIRHGGLMFIFDEAHFLLPTRFSKDTPPARLNWIRTRIADHGCPLVLVSTPQDFKHCVDRFTRATGHNINQFLGRTLLTVRLPAELENADLLAVAKHHFPDVDEDYLDLIVAKAEQSESYLMAVESIAKRARFISRREGHAAVTLADLKTAISEVVPGATAPARPAPLAPAPAPHKQPLAVKRGRAVTPQPAPAAPALGMSARDTAPGGFAAGTAAPAAAVNRTRPAAATPALEMPPSRQTAPELETV